MSNHYSTNNVSRHGLKAWYGWSLNASGRSCNRVPEALLEKLEPMIHVCLYMVCVYHQSSVHTAYSIVYHLGGSEMCSGTYTSMYVTIYSCSHTN